MKITKVTAWWIQIPIEEARQHTSDFGTLRTFDAAILKIETDDGLIGWGEGKNAAGSAGNYGTLVRLINEDFGPRLPVAEQVDRLILQATDVQNLCQSFVGWCPFW